MQLTRENSYTAFPLGSGCSALSKRSSISIQFPVTAYCSNSWNISLSKKTVGLSKPRWMKEGPATNPARQLTTEPTALANVNPILSINPALTMLTARRKGELAQTRSSSLDESFSETAKHERKKTLWLYEEKAKRLIDNVYITISITVRITV